MKLDKLVKYNYFISLKLFLGFLYEKTGSYDLPFYVAGALITFSAVLCYPLNYVKNWQERRLNKRKIAVAA